MFGFTRIGTYAVAPPEEIYFAVSDNLLSARNVSLNIKTINATFTLARRPAGYSHGGYRVNVTVHGSRSGLSEQRPKTAVQAMVPTQGSSSMGRLPRMSDSLE